ncbi:MAG: hypothetical protein MUC51_12275 [Anaerolineae bacterium]|jgi:hypothetical protein|nr:hypothetical protein [Anaerolineae bacterium]
MNEQLEEAQQTVAEIRALIGTLPIRDRMIIDWRVSDLHAMLSRFGHLGRLALALCSAEIQLQDAEEEWAEHERRQLAEQEALGA